jgi:dCMP deaminase
MLRPSWDEYFAKIAEDVALRSTCIRRAIGAVVVNPSKEIVATGYNGVVRGAPHCDEAGCVKDDLAIPSGTGHEICPAVHAEQNAIMQAGKKARGSVLYLTSFPCKICARLIVNAGISKVVISGDYTDKEGLTILKDGNIKIKHVYVK